MTTTTDLLDLNGIGQRQSEVRYEVLDQALNVIGTVKPLDSALPVIENNIHRTVKRDLRSMRLATEDQAAIDPFADRLRPVWVLENGATYSLGIFIFGSMDRLRREYGLDADVSAVDQTIILDQGVETTVSLNTGDSVRTALLAQFAAAMIPVYDVDTSIGTSISAPIAWPAGTTRLRIINDLAAMGSAYSAYFDNNGVGRVRRVESVTEVTVADHIYHEGGRILRGSMVETDDLIEAPNRYLVIDSAAVEAAITGFFDVPADAPHSAFNRGFVVTKVIDEQGLGSVTEAQDRAIAAYSQDRGNYQWAQFSSPPDPRHDTFDSVDYLGTIYREQNWMLPLIEGSEMTHSLRKTYS